MTPHGAAKLIEMRVAGKCPSVPVWVNVGPFKLPAWMNDSDTAEKPEIVILPNDPIERLDFRPLLNLRLILFFNTFDARADAIYQRLTEYAQSISVLCPDFGEDIGWFWIKGRGRVEFYDVKETA